MKRLLFVILLIAVLVCSIRNPAPIEKAIAFVERTPPVVHIISQPAGIGTEASQLVLELEDLRSGVRVVSLSGEQGAKNFPLFEKRFDEAGVLTNVRMAVPLPGRESPFEPGVAALLIRADDRSIWRNSAEQRLEIKVDFDEPKLKVLTAQHNVSQSGVSLTFFAAEDNSTLRGGVRVDDLVFPSYPASELDPAFAGHPEVQFAFFAVPFAFDPDKGVIEAFCEDAVGNRSSVKLSRRVKRKQRPPSRIELSKAFLDLKVNELFPLYQRDVVQDLSKASESQDEEEILRRFRLINERYRGWVDEFMKPFFEASVHRKIWSAAFQRPLSGATTSPFGEERSYFYQGREMGKSFHDGIDLASVLNDAVHASNDGVVVFSGDLGIYGGTLIVDHGFGLLSLYGHLSSMGVRKGDQVRAGDEIARTGDTGLAGGDHLHFELILAGVSVTPIEWWDPKWIRDHIQTKIDFVLQSLEGVGT